MRETTPRTAAVMNDSFKVKSSGMLKENLSSGSLDEPRGEGAAPARGPQLCRLTELRLTNLQLSSARTQGSAYTCVKITRKITRKSY